MLSYTKVLKKLPTMFAAKRSVAKARHVSTNYYRCMSTMMNKQKFYNYEKNEGRTRKFFPAAALGLLSLVGGWEMLKKKLSNSAECCGIIGYIGQDNIAGRLVLDGLQILQYRGYDS